MAANGCLLAILVAVAAGLFLAWRTTFTPKVQTSYWCTVVGVEAQMRQSILDQMAAPLRYDSLLGLHLVERNSAFALDLDLDAELPREMYI